jgi:hypothetical protein
VDATPVFEACEQVLDLMALTVENGILAVLNAMLCMGRDAGRDVPLDKRLSESG